MRRMLWSVLLGALLLAASACAQTAQPIRLPAADELEWIRLTCGAESVLRQDADWLETFLESAAQARPTAKASVQDAPNYEGMVQLDLGFRAGGGSTLFAYPLRGKWYLEQPYQGIYEIDEPLWKTLSDQSG